MKINKSLDIDLNIISPQRNIQIHEGDIDSIDIVLAVSADDVSLDLTGLIIKYDATINNYLAEQDADGDVVEDKIVIPVTENMTAMPGLLLIDVRMIQGDEILFTRTIRATVERAVVGGSVYIDFSKITINQRLNALEEQMAYVEELVDGLDTSKQITSNRRPPQTAPATVDVDFFRAGDTWIYKVDNIVYKLIEVEYNYQPDPLIPAVHKFRWQPLNERFNFGITEPPENATYTPIEYIIGELTFSTLPVPEYFKGDTYAQLVSGAVETLFTLTNSAEVSSGQYTFTWHENGGGDDDNKMDLAPINPTAEEIAAMSSGQIYDEADDGVVTIKGGTELLGVLKNVLNPEYGIKGKVGQIASYGNSFYQCFGQNEQGTYIWKLISFAGSDVIRARATTTGASGKYIITSSVTLQEVWELFTKYQCVKIAITNQYNQEIGETCLITRVTGNNYEHLSAVMLPTDRTETTYPINKRVHFLEQHAEGSSFDTLRLETKYVYPPYEEYYTKTEINAMIGDIGSAIDTLNNNLAEV